MTTRPRLPASEVERMADKLSDVYCAAEFPRRGGWFAVARYVLRYYVPRKRPAKTGTGKR